MRELCVARLRCATARQPLPPDAGGEGWWEMLVMLQFVTSDFIL